MSGDQISRDVAMHQGAAWPWMLGLFVDAALRTAGDRMDEISRLRGLLGGLYGDTSVEDFGGLCPEMFHASAPHVPDGCFAHGPAVTEVSRVAWLLRGER
jgi:glycogen debranching enzyme